MNKLIEDYLLECEHKKQAKRAIQGFMEYLKDRDTSKEAREFFFCKGKSLTWIKSFKRDVYIHDVKGQEKTFRECLKLKTKSLSTRNDILLGLERFFSHLILIESSRTGKIIENPVDIQWDRFKVKIKHGTVRRPVPRHIVELMKTILIADDFIWSRENFKEDMIGDIFSMGTSLMMYIMLVLPLRGIQAQYLDSGERDEFIYDFKLREMVKNPKGIKGRSEGFLRKSFYSGVSRESCESLWINTNKGNHGGFEIPWCNEELIRLIEKQMDYLKKYGKAVRVLKDEAGKSRDVYCLFQDGRTGGPISKNKLYRLWTKLCIEVERRTGESLTQISKRKVKPLFDLHSLRVSGVSWAMEQGMDLSMVSKSFVGHKGEQITLHYVRTGSLKEIVNQAEGSRAGGLLDYNKMEALNEKA